MKEIKTNAMRFLDKKKIAYDVIQYECDEFTDGIAVADKCGIPYERSYKTLVTQGKSKRGGRIGSSIRMQPLELKKVTGAAFEDICTDL